MFTLTKHPKQVCKHWSTGASYGIIAILEIVKEDIEKEMKECFADNNADQGESEKSNGALQKTQFQ